MTRRRPSCLVIAALALAGCPEGPVATDGGPSPPDEGDVTVDAGPPREVIDDEGGALLDDDGGVQTPGDDDGGEGRREAGPLDDGGTDGDGGSGPLDVDAGLIDVDGGALPSAPPKNIILFIGDGMGPAAIEAARIYDNGGGAPLSFETLPVAGTMRTRNYSGLVTDSGAAATAMATGHKAHNSTISVMRPGDLRAVPTVLELLAAEGKSTGLVTQYTVISDATPAAFGAHEALRSSHAAIVDDYFTGSRPNVLLGKAHATMTVSAAEAAGYTVVTTPADFAALDPGAAEHISGQLSSGTAPSLPDKTAFALAALEDDPDGFFLMVEHEGTDELAHGNNLAGVIASLLELRDAFDVAAAWADGRDDTLLVVLADHETGGLTVTETTPQAGEIPEHTWERTGHTGTDVRVFAGGPTSERFLGSYENTYVFTALSRRAVVQRQQGVRGYSGTVDGYLDEGLPQSSPDGEAFLAVSDAPLGQGGEKQALLRFDGALDEIAAGDEVLDAVLFVNVVEGGDGVALHRLLRPFDASSTWDSFADGAALDDVEAAAAADAESAATLAPGLHALDVTASVRAWQASPALALGWLVVGKGNDGVLLDSSEGATPPYLVISRRLAE